MIPKDRPNFYQVSRLPGTEMRFLYKDQKKYSNLAYMQNNIQRYTVFNSQPLWMLTHSVLLFFLITRFKKKKKIQLIINVFEILTEGQVPTFLSGLCNIWYTLSFLDNTVVCQMYDNTFTEIGITDSIDNCSTFQRHLSMVKSWAFGVWNTASYNLWLWLLHPPKKEWMHKTLSSEVYKNINII